MSTSFETGLESQEFNMYQQYIPPPPIEKVSEEVTSSSGDPSKQRGDIFVNKDGKLMRTFMEYYGITRDR